MRRSEWLYLVGDFEAARQQEDFDSSIRYTSEADKKYYEGMNRLYSAVRREQREIRVVQKIIRHPQVQTLLFRGHVRAPYKQ